MAQIAFRKLVKNYIFPFLKYSFGFLTFSVDENDKTFLSFTDLVLFLLHFSFGTFISVYSWKTLDFQSIESSIILIGNRITFNITIIIGLTTMIFAIIHGNSIWKVVISLDEIEEIVS